MEGIFDARAADDCFWCALLHPGADDCPRCGKRMRWLPAAAMSDVELRARVADTAAAYLDAPGLDTLTELLELLHRFHPVAVTYVAETTPLTLDQIRRDWAGLGAETP